MIKDLELHQVYNSVNEKTLKVSVITDRGIFSASAPSGTSKGRYEAKALDNGTVIKKFPQVKKRFIGKNEKDVDNIVKRIGIEKIGSNLSTILSIASVRALSKNDAYKYFNHSAHVFPFPLGNVIGGGSHKGYTSEQEFLALPLKARTMKEAVDTNLSIWKDVGKLVKSKRIFLGNNYEGAWMCKLNDIETLNVLSGIAEDYGARIGIDFAASGLYKNGKYNYKNPERKFSAAEQLDFVSSLVRTYNLVYVEDPFHENDFKNFSELTRKVKCLVTGDDIFVTQAERLRIGVKRKAGNAIIIKPNQVGLISKTLETVKVAKKANYKTVVSHRSRDTVDSFIADMAVGIESPIIKCGINGKERTSKLDRLIEIWNEVEKPEMAKVNI